MRTREEILREIISKGKEIPKGWKATSRYDTKVHATEYNILHPDVGIYQIKEWQKNPFQIKGVGAKIARRVDDSLINEPLGRFGILQYNPRKILGEVTEDLPLKKILQDMASGGQKTGMEMMLTGEMHPVDKDITKTVQKKQNEINKALIKIQENEGLYDSYI
jgi:hypothetical protein